MARKLNTTELRNLAGFLMQVTLVTENPRVYSPSIERKVREFTSRHGLVDVVSALAERVAEISQPKIVRIDRECEPLIVL